jgi:hypothetical protein
MAQITKAIRDAYGFTADLIPHDILKSIDDAELRDRLVHVTELVRKSKTDRDPDLRKGYGRLARAVLEARPRAVVGREASQLIAKAAGCPNMRQADALRRQAEELLAEQPPAPRREDHPAVEVAKATAGSGTVVICYDSAGRPVGVCDPAKITPVTEAQVAKMRNAERAPSSRHRRR